jgi:ribosomal protein L23
MKKVAKLIILKFEGDILKIKFWVPRELDEGKVKTALSKIYRIKIEEIKIVATKKQH